MDDTMYQIAVRAMMALESIAASLKKLTNPGITMTVGTSTGRIYHQPNLEHPGCTCGNTDDYQAHMTEIGAQCVCSAPDLHCEVHNA